MVIPDGESGGTDDSKYRSPGTCTIHSSTSVVLPSEEDTENMGSTKVETVRKPFGDHKSSAEIAA